MKTYEQWIESQIDLEEFLIYPCEVDYALVEDQLSCVPPAYNENYLLQVGDTYKHIKGVPYYFTFSSVGRLDEKGEHTVKYFYLGILPKFTED